MEGGGGGGGGGGRRQTETDGQTDGRSGKLHSLCVSMI